jgi:dihydroneopterin aldolase
MTDFFSFKKEAEDYLRIIIRDLIVDAHVGLHPWEQHLERPTRLIINIELFAHLYTKLEYETKHSIMDYDHIRDALKKWPNRPHTPLLETLLAEITDLCFVAPRVEACRVSIVKPDIFNEVAAVGVEVYKTRPKSE